MEQSKYQTNEMHLFIGYGLVALGFLSFFTGVYSVVVSKLLMPDTGHLVLDWIKHDYYYCCLVPSYLLLIPFIGFLNWCAMKFFRHG